jgi:hypothetical protein
VGNAADLDPSPGCGSPSAGPKRSRRQAAGRKARSLRYRLWTLALRRDFLSLDEHHNMGHRGRRLPARGSWPPGKTMRKCQQPLHAAQGGEQPGQTTRKGGSLKSGQSVPFHCTPKLPQFGENDPSTEFPHKRRPELRSNGAATKKPVRASNPGRSASQAYLSGRVAQGLGQFSILDIGLALPAACCHLLTAAASQAGRSTG